MMNYELEFQINCSYEKSTIKYIEKLGDEEKFIEIENMIYENDNTIFIQPRNSY